ncbi:MAG: inositol monophosphatase family protein [Candidatus Hydrogenedentales bacterium]
MNFDLSHPDIKFALEAVADAARLARKIQVDAHAKRLDKSDLSPVTVADFAGQATVAHALSLAFGSDVMVGEEESVLLRGPDAQDVLHLVSNYVREIIPGASDEDVMTWIDRGTDNVTDRYWTLDPIDGTKGYLRGDQYAVALALVEDGEVRVGILGMPNLGPDCALEGEPKGVLALAVRGEGAGWAPLDGDHKEFKPLRVSDCDTLSKARLLRSLVSGHTNVDQLEEMSQAIGLEAPPLARDSQAKYGMLAAGHGEILLRLLSPKQPDYKECVWDQAAGSIVVEEAGGRVTDLDGKALDFSAGRRLTKNTGICATNGQLHDRVLEALQAVR